MEHQAEKAELKKHKKKSQGYIIVASVTISIPLTEIGLKRYWCCEKKRICNAPWTNGQDLDNTIIQDEQKNFSTSFVLKEK